MKNNTDKHHRKPQSIGGESTLRNLSKVKAKKHAAWHLIFSNKTAPEIAEEINTVWIDPDYVLVPVFVGDKQEEETKQLILKIQKNVF